MYIHRSPLCPWKGMASTGPRGEVSQRSTIVSTTRANLAQDAPLALRTLKRDPTGPCHALSQLVLLGIEPVTPTSQIGEITKSSPRRTHCELWVCFFGWEVEGTDADTVIYFNNLQIILKTRLPYACPTGYATIPPPTIVLVRNDNSISESN